MRCKILILLAITALASFPSQANADIVLGMAQNFAVLGASTVTNAGPSTIFGDLGVSPGTDITGFPPGVVYGTIRANDAVAVQAQADAAVAYGVLAGLPVNQYLSGQDLGGLTLPPGVYCFLSSAQLSGQLILDGQGQADPLFVFQIGSTLTTASDSSIIGINGANAGDVYFQVGSSATLGTGTMFAGTIIAFASDTINVGASVNGRVIALNGAVTLNANAVHSGRLGDLNCDGVVNAFDIDPFILALTDPAVYAAAFPACDRMLADINGDGVVNAFDIDPFIALLTG